jgi:succinate dehydrogenase/fumarate reductase-like Fe-S protein
MTGVVFSPLLLTGLRLISIKHAITLRFSLYGCLEEVCGACSMVINGQARQSCSAIVDQLEQPIKLEPMSTFPVIVVFSLAYEGLVPNHTYRQLVPKLSYVSSYQTF